MPMGKTSGEGKAARSSDEKPVGVLYGAGGKGRK